MVAPVKSWVPCDIVKLPTGESIKILGLVNATSPPRTADDTSFATDPKFSIVAPSKFIIDAPLMNF